MVATLVLVTRLDLAADFAAVRYVLLAHAFAAATQDVAIDGLAIAGVAPAEEGRLNAWMQVGMLSGRALFGGGALVLVKHVGDRGLIWLLVACVTGVGFVVLWLREPAAAKTVSGRFALRGILKRRETWHAIAVALSVAAGFEAVGGLLGPFLIDAGWSESRVGLVGFLPSMLAMILGAQAGGLLADRWSAARAASLLCVLVFAAVLGLAGAHRLGFTLLPWTLTLYALTGALTAASYALFMALSRGAFAATRFSAFMGATNACEAWAVAAAGALSVRFGYGVAFTLVAAVSLLSIWPLSRLVQLPSVGKA
jgi:MFS transporter (putative signal transducer)